MGLKLYEYDERIAEAYEAAIDPETGEIKDTLAVEELERLEEGKEEKIEGLLLWYKEMIAEADAIKKEKLALADRQSKMEKKAENLKGFLQRYLAGEKFKTARVSVSYRNTETAEYKGNVFLLPENCLRYKDPEINKDELKKALKSGIEIEGAWLEPHTSMSVR